MSYLQNFTINQTFQTSFQFLILCLLLLWTTLIYLTPTSVSSLLYPSGTETRANHRLTVSLRSAFSKNKRFPLPLAIEWWFTCCIISWLVFRPLGGESPRGQKTNHAAMNVLTSSMLIPFYVEYKLVKTINR